MNGVCLVYFINSCSRRQLLPIYLFILLQKRSCTRYFTAFQVIIHKLLINIILWLLWSADYLFPRTDASFAAAQWITRHHGSFAIWNKWILILVQFNWIEQVVTCKLLLTSRLKLIYLFKVVFSTKNLCSYLIILYFFNHVYVKFNSFDQYRANHFHSLFRSYPFYV